MITNPRRKKQMDEFWDKEHSVMHQYYEVLEKKISQSKLLEKMQELIKKDPDFYDSYVVAADILESMNKKEMAAALRSTAFERAMHRIVDKEGNFPKRIEWGWLDNRHLVRSIECWAQELWGQGKNEEALDLFRKLLKANPHDNIGARHNILAIRLGLGPDYESKFETKDMPGYLDAIKVMEWFDKNVKKFPEEFEWWLKSVKE
ncbi:MAG TPA: hypothetical protein VJI32_02680 [Candidatus Nanoarchaeia archaeon]|nr:hypothetical protein [Candidatus Nanoarchaeia archaeon]